MRLGSEARYIKRNSRILWRDVGESERRAPYGDEHGHTNEHSTPVRPFQLGQCEKAVEGESIYRKYTLVLECLRYLLLAGLNLYLRIFKSKPFPPRLGEKKPPLSSAIWGYRICP